MSLSLWFGWCQFTLRRYGLWPICGTLSVKKERWAD
jgi:hypothetical protein